VKEGMYEFGKLIALAARWSYDPSQLECKLAFYFPIRMPQSKDDTLRVGLGAGISRIRQNRGN
jgi:hypothetical protein